MNYIDLPGVAGAGVPTFLKLGWARRRRASLPCSESRPEKKYPRAAAVRGDRENTREQMGAHSDSC